MNSGSDLYWLAVDGNWASERTARPQIVTRKMKVDVKELEIDRFVDDTIDIVIGEDFTDMTEGAQIVFI